MNHAKFDLCGMTPAYVIIRDLGPWSEHPTITNDPQWVVEQLLPFLNGRRLLYFDSANDLDEIVIKDGKFAGFLFFQGHHAR